jgi:hypothetical protein
LLRQKMLRNHSVRPDDQKGDDEKLNEKMQFE